MIIKSGFSWLNITKNTTDWFDIYNFMKLGQSLGNDPKNLKKLVIKTRYISDC
jgi:hypothetical protein